MEDIFKVTEFRIKLYPKDFDKVREFYMKELNFTITNEWNRSSNDRGTMFDVGGTTLELLTPADSPVKGCDLSLAIPDVWKLWELLKDKDYVTRGLRDNAWGDTSFRVSGPEGLSISLFTKHTGANFPRPE